MTEPTVDLDELAAWLCRWYSEAQGVNARAGHSPAPITPGLLQYRRRLGWNRACSALEALEARGDLERIPGPTLAYRPAPPPLPFTKAFPLGGGYALPLSPKEHGALLRLLDGYLGQVYGWKDDDKAALRAIRSRLKRP